MSSRFFLWHRQHLVALGSAGHGMTPRPSASPSPLLQMQQHRLRHINHPGHKMKPPCNPIKLELPDRYVDEAVYPPVKPKYPPGDWLPDADTKLAWRYYTEGQQFHSLRTVQERLSVMAYLNAQITVDDVLHKTRTRHYPIFQLSSVLRTARSLPFYEYITKTAPVSIVSSSSSTSEEAGAEATTPPLVESIDERTYEALRESVKDAILLAYHKEEALSDDAHEPPLHPDTYKPAVLERNEQLERKLNKSNALIKAIMDVVVPALSASEANAHLLTAQYGTEVNVKAYWKRCGYKEQNPRGAASPDQDVVRFQFDDVATYQIKCNMPLQPLYKLGSSECTNQEIPECTFNPIMYKVHADHILPSQVPGHWYGDKREFNYLTVYNTTKLFEFTKQRFGDLNEDLNALKIMAISAGHAELTAQAYYLGFSMWKDLTYPLRARLLLTNGQDFAFADYQLNTLRLWNKATPLCNTCRVSIPERLFELTDDKTAVVKFNDSTFRKLLNTLAEQPIADDKQICADYSPLDYMIGGTALRPYLSVQDIDKQLSARHRLLVTSLYELVKYDKPANYLNQRSESLSERPHLSRRYSKYTYAFRDIVLDYYPKEYYGYRLVRRMMQENAVQKPKYWDLKDPVYEWANVPPPDINSIPRKINLSTF